MDDNEIRKLNLQAQQFGWLDVELEHAIQTAEDQDQYEDECVVKLLNGRELRTPAYPESCSYVRITQNGYELAYWVSDEWAEDAEDVMGAIVGAMAGR